MPPVLFVSLQELPFGKTKRALLSYHRAPQKGKSTQGFALREVGFLRLLPKEVMGQLVNTNSEQMSYGMLGEIMSLFYLGPPFYKYGKNIFHCSRYEDLVRIHVESVLG